MRTLMLSCGVLAALAFSSVPLAAQTRAHADMKTCTNADNPGPAAIAACSRLIAGKAYRGNDLANLYVWRTLNRMKSGDMDGALVDADVSIKLDPGNAHIYDALGFIYLVKGDFDRSLAEYNRAIALKPTEQSFYQSRGVVYQGKRNYERALVDYAEAVRLGPRTASGYFAMVSRGITYNLMGDTAKAASEIEGAIKAQPKRSDAFVVRANIARIAGDLDRAVADLSTAIALEPTSVPALTARALVSEARGDVANAIKDYTRIEEFKPADFAGKGGYGVDWARYQDTARTRLALLKANPAAAAAAQTVPLKPLPSPAAAPAHGSSPAPVAIAQATPAPKEIRRALVIGNGAYAGVTALANPSRDAKSIAANLRSMGFEVSEGIDLDGASMKRTVDEFLIKAATARMALVFYAGHGMQIDGKNFLVPVDAGANGSDLKAGMIEVDTILAGLDDQVRTNIVILDACRDNPLAANAQIAAASRSMNVRSGLAAPSGLGAGATLGAGTLLAFATAPGAVALDGDGANSPFSTALNRHITTPGLEVQAMLTRVRAEVVASTANKQVPWSNSSLLGEVFLVTR